MKLKIELALDEEVLQALEEYWAEEYEEWLKAQE
jgi:hypothetical protein